MDTIIPGSRSTLASNAESDPYGGASGDLKQTMTLAKLVAVLVVGFMFAALFTPIASAGNNGAVSETPTPADFVYWEAGLLVMTGSTSQACSEPPLALPGLAIESGNGQLIWRNVGSIAVSAYEIPDIPAERLDLLNEWILDNCDTEAIASGTAHLRSSFRFDAKGVLHIRNGLNGTLTTPEGDAVQVRTFARVSVDAGTGALIEIHQLEAELH